MRQLDIWLAILAGLSQFGNAFMGWKVTRQTLSTLQRKVYDVLFVLVGVIGVVSIAFLAARAGRQERVHFSAAIGNTYQAVDKTQGGAIIAFSWFVIDKPLAFNVFLKNVGNGSAYNVEEHLRSFIKPDTSRGSQQEAVADFQSWLLVQPHNSKSWPKDNAQFSTASGEVLSPEDYSNLTTGRRTVFVIGKVTFNDDFGSHELDICQALLPQESIPPGAFPSLHVSVPIQEIWSDCETFDSEK